jgi:primosomal protein N' (replication factor Y)
MQVAGRSGRSHLKGEVVIQCMNVTHYSIQLARKHDFSSFYHQEIKHRGQFQYPPFSRVIKIMVVSDSLHETISLSRVLSAEIRRHLSGGAVLVGPAPDLYPKVRNLHRWQLNIKLPQNPGSVTKTLKSRILKIIDPYLVKPKKGMQVHVDVDPFTV